MNTHALPKLLSATLFGMLAVVPSLTRAQETNPLLLDPETARAAGIEVDTLAARTLQDELKAPGEVKVDAYSTELVSPRVASQVIARKAKLGDVVTAGTSLVVLSSVDVAETQGELIVASQDWQRVAALGPQAVSARRYNEALVKRDQAKARLKAYGLSDAQITRLVRRGSAAADGTFELLAPRAGRITTDAFLVGERIEAGRPLFTLVTESSVWVEARLSPADAEQVHEGDAAMVSAHGNEMRGHIVQRSHQTDETTRTVDVRIRVPNENDLLHPGELVETRLSIRGKSSALAVPSEAIVLLQNQPTLFTQAKAGAPFVPLPVETGDARDGWTEITRGAAAGTRYVRRGAFALKARVLRSQLGDD
jgi:cobalt-zinc-cadmium efflux system membrane fusion protein